MYIDTHTHLNFKAFKKDWEDVVERALESGIDKMIVVGTDIDSSIRAVEMAEKHPALHASVGVHPHHVRALRDIPNLKSQISKIRRNLREFSEHPKVVAIGEVGLDYHYYSKSKKYEMENNDRGWKKLKTLQKKLFKIQVELAKEIDKPLIIHSREAGEEVLDLITNINKQKKWKLKGVFHCFEGDDTYLEKVLKAGLLVSFTGNITYSDDRASVACKVPLDRLLLETDCPFMSPVPHRGERNEPAHVKIVARKHSQIRGIHLNEVIEMTTKNAGKLFKI